MLNQSDNVNKVLRGTVYDTKCRNIIVSASTH